MRYIVTFVSGVAFRIEIADEEVEIIYGDEIITVEVGNPVPVGVGRVGVEGFDERGEIVHRDEIIVVGVACQ